MGETTTLLPLTAKTRLMEAFPQFRAEIARALAAVSEADEIHLVGKQFATADLDVARPFQSACAGKQRAVWYVDPSSASSACVARHNEIFNADEVEVRLLPGVGAYVEALSAS